MPELHFISYGGGAPKYYQCLNNLCMSVDKTKIFNTIRGYTDKSLRDDHECPGFWSNHGEFIAKCEANKERGFGYWLWKPYLTKKRLSEIAEGDILVYMDAGCIFNPDGIPRLFQYVDMVNNHPTGTLGFLHNKEWTLDRPEGLLEEEFTKRDMFDWFYPDGDYEFARNRTQMIGGIFMIRKCPTSVSLVDKWYNACQNYDILRDEPNIGPKLPKFREHRHDQSAWSIIRHDAGSILIDNEVYFGGKWQSQEALKYPFWAFQMPHKIR